MEEFYKYIGISVNNSSLNQIAMNKMTSKEYLIDITLVSLDVGRQTKTASKVLCEIHYGDGDSYLRIKLQPLVKNGIASFYQERIRIPYSSEIALVFKMFKSKKEIFLGHYTIEVEKYLQQKVYAAKLKEKLQESDAWVDFQLKIIDKQLFCDEESDDLEDENLFPTSRSNYSEEQKSRANFSDCKPKSDLHAPFVVIKRHSDLRPPLLPEQFNKLLLGVDDLLKKHRVYAQNTSEGPNNKNDQVGTKSSGIIKLEDRIEGALKNQKINNYILWLCVALVALFVGIVIKN